MTFDHTNATSSSTSSANDLFAMLVAPRSVPRALVNVSTTLSSLRALRSFGHDWDGNGSAAPRVGAIDAASRFVQQSAEDVVSTRAGWARPHVSANEDGNVVLEWWCGARKLTLYISQHSASYVRVWGPDMVGQMQDGELPEGEFINHWNWLTERYS